MKKIITALAALALAVAAAVLPVSPANAITCYAFGATPYKLSSGAVVGPGNMSCSGGNGNLSIRVYLTRTGTQVAMVDHYCSNANECADFATKTDITGGQTYCTWTLAYVQGTFVDQSPTYCESASW